MRLRSYYHDEPERMELLALTTVQLAAVEGRKPFGSLLIGPARTILDLAHTGHASITFAGDRKPSIGKCVGCRAIVSKAWLVEPVGITVAACCPDCVADKVEAIWVDAGEYIAVRKPGVACIADAVEVAA